MYSESGRLVQYGNILGDWKIRKLLYRTNDGRTLVFLVVKQGVRIEEKCALKCINIITREERWETLAEEDKRDYQDYKQELCIKAEKEVAHMSELQGYKNIVTYHDFAFANWVEEERFGCDLLIRMELLSTLEDKMKREGNLPEEEIVHIGTDICQALIHCKAHNILHRDIKPGNIFINSHGEYLLGDFGIARIIKSNLGARTATGTLEYAAPEQVLGLKEDSYDERVDIYSLGLTLYQIANDGKLPFAQKKLIREGENNQRLIGKKIPEPCGVSKSLGKVILRAVEYEAKQRYQTAEDFMTALSYQNVEESISDDNLTEDTYATKVALSGGNGISNELSSNEENQRMVNDAFVLSDNAEVYEGDLDDLLQLAEENEDPELEYKIATIYKENGNDEEEVYWLIQSAEHGCPRAQCCLSGYYYSGYKVEKSMDESRKWLWSAAQQNDIEAMYHMGMRYFIGDEEEQDYEHAAFWFWKASLAGHEKSKEFLLDCFVSFSKDYLLGKGFFIDDTGIIKFKEMLEDSWKIRKSISFFDIEAYLDQIMNNICSSKIKLFKDIILQRRQIDSELIVLTSTDFIV